ALAVEQAMKACARKYAPDEDPVRWGMAGLLHDFDYEQYPNADQHPYVGSKILEEAGFDEELRTAIMGHAPYTAAPRTTAMAKALFACDELCGFLVACALVQPSKSMACQTVVGEEEAEGQGVRAQRQPRRHLQRRSGAGRGP